MISRLLIRDSVWLNFIHFSRYSTRLVSRLRKREDQALIIFWLTTAERAVSAVSLSLVKSAAVSCSGDSCFFCPKKSTEITQFPSSFFWTSNGNLIKYYKYHSYDLHKKVSIVKVSLPENIEPCMFYFRTKSLVCLNLFEQHDLVMLIWRLYIIKVWNLLIILFSIDMAFHELQGLPNTISVRCNIVHFYYIKSCNTNILIYYEVNCKICITYKVNSKMWTAHTVN